MLARVTYRVADLEVFTKYYPHLFLYISVLEGHVRKTTNASYSHEVLRFEESIAVMCVHAQSLSRVQLSVIPWSVAHQAPLTVEFSKQKYWSVLPFPSPGDLPDPGIEPASPALASGLFTTEPPGKQKSCTLFFYILKKKFRNS